MTRRVSRSMAPVQHKKVGGAGASPSAKAHRNSKRSSKNVKRLIDFVNKEHRLPIAKTEEDLYRFLRQLEKEKDDPGQKSLHAHLAQHLPITPLWLQEDWEKVQLKEAAEREQQLKAQNETSGSCG